MCDQAVTGYKLTNDISVNVLSASSISAKTAELCSLTALRIETDTLTAGDIMADTVTAVCGNFEKLNVENMGTMTTWINAPDANNGSLSTTQLNPEGANYVIPATLIYPTNTQTGAGTRLTFNGTSGALRAGTVTGAQWDTVGANSLSTGTDNAVTGANAVGIGGSGHTVSGDSSVAIGGSSGHTVSGDSSVAIGGGGNTILSNFSSTFGGFGHTIDLNSSYAVGGGGNNILGSLGGSNGTIGGGGNTINTRNISSGNALICGGFRNTIDPITTPGFIANSFIAGGQLNTIETQRCGIIVSDNSTIIAEDTVIVGGFTNRILGGAGDSAYSIVLGGNTNAIGVDSGGTIMGTLEAAIVGGNNVFNIHNRAIVLGVQNFTTNQTDTTYTNRIRHLGGTQQPVRSTGASSTNLGLDDFVVLMAPAGGGSTATLPAAPVVGQEYYIKNINGVGTLTINAGVGNLINPNGAAASNVTYAAGGGGIKETVHIVCSQTGPNVWEIL